MNAEIFYNLLNEDELFYLNELINNKNEWKYRTKFKDFGQYFDSIVVDKNKLKQYFNIITNNGELMVKETALNIITINTQLENSTHKDESDVSYATYFNNDFIGGEFVYYDKNDTPIQVIPTAGLTIKIYKETLHQVNKVKSGIRFSLYTFLQKKQKNIKTLI